MCALQYYIPPCKIALLGSTDHLPNAPILTLLISDPTKLIYSDRQLCNQTSPYYSKSDPLLHLQQLQSGSNPLPAVL